MVLVRLRLGVSVGEGNVRGEAVDDGAKMNDGWVVIPKSDIALHKDSLYTLAHLRRTASMALRKADQETSPGLWFDSASRKA
jgi:hypothetical protein